MFHAKLFLGGIKQPSVTGHLGVLLRLGDIAENIKDEHVTLLCHFIIENACLRYDF